MSTESIVYNGKTYGSDEIKSISFNKTESLPAAALGVNTLTVVLAPPAVLRLFTAEPLSFLTRDKLDFYVQSGASVVMDQAQPIRYLRDGSQVALAYPKELKQLSDHNWQLTCMSSVGRLTQMSHRGGVYAGTLLEAIVADICGDVPYFIQSNFANIALYGWLPSVAPSGEDGAKKGSARDNLMRVLFAAGANLTTDANGVLRIENLPNSVQSEFDASRVYINNASDTKEAPVTAVTILEYQYIPGGEQKELFSGTTIAGQVIHFPEPMSNLSATGFSIVESGANYAVVSAGSGTLTGRAYTVTTREVTRTVSESDTPNEIKLTDTTLVSIVNSTDVINRLAAFYACRETIGLDVDFSFENPGDLVDLYNPMTKSVVSACIAQLAATTSEIMKAHISALVGYTPWQTIPFSDEHVILTASGTYTFPSDIADDTEVTVIVIGGGDGGTKGGNGANGTAYPKSGSFTPPGSLSTGAGAGGQGGAAGVHGNGGKILRAALIVNPGQQVQVTIGAGGAANGGSGGNTVFGSISSATGASSDAGYYNPVSGTTYGIPGTDGVAGGNGGNGGSAGSDGQAGGNVGTNTGGRGGKGYKKTPWLSNTTENIGGAGGGGAAKGANGGAGFDPPPSSYGQAQPGGAGGSGAAAAAAVHYGDGGSGGNGGGGGGGGGAWSFNDPDSGSTTSYYYNSVGGSGGTGSAGSAGKQGCVILIYRKPAQT